MQDGIQDSRGEELVELTSPIAGTVVYIAKGAGQGVDPDSAVVAVESPSLMAVAVEAGVAGMVQEILVGVGDEVEPRHLLAMLSTSTETIIEQDDASSPTRVCTHCGSKLLEAGFVEVASPNSAGFARWMEGRLERGLFGPRRMGRQRRVIEAYRCTQCAHLDHFATELD